MKVDIRADFGARLLENACGTLMRTVFGSCMTGFDIGFIPRLLSGTGKIDKIGNIYIYIYIYFGVGGCP